MKKSKNIIGLIIPFFLFFSWLLIFQFINVDGIIFYVLLWVLTITWVVFCCINRFCNVWILPVSFILPTVPFLIIMLLTRDEGAAGGFWLTASLYSLPLFAITFLISISIFAITQVQSRFLDKSNKKETD